ncbi:putative MFS family arabinose efflux permease [Halohasta litchfieldiae]|uniref:Predicted arabinose efflux permease, MFS family n=1 Tax=Halohasta litchfieldiae TaxID=1073996 RepID=A0A1H6UM95_9EURY|nr:MFS transporter [Halohasta litchfieldiae]ATW89459.1 putative MFS family arabinose efflux permease [Halohasta litchfieldiae]SEI92796.1 Predicted arabinose efflux permease, MFS family [Halohasta litchfieldiae]
MSRRHLFGSLCGLVFFLNLARIVFAPLLDVFIAEFGIGEATAGLIVTLAWVGSASLRLPAGWLLTRFPRHYLVIVSGAILTLSAAATATAVTVQQLMIGAFFMGSASGVYFVSANPLLSELFPSRVGRVMGIHGAANQVAAVAAAPLVAISLWVDWRLSLWTIAVGTAVVTAATVIVARRTEMPDAGADDSSLLAGARSEWRIILAALGLAGVAVFVWQGVFNFYELYMQSRGLSPNAASTMLTIVFTAGVPAFFVAGELVDDLPSVPLLLGIVASFAGCLLLLVAAEGLVALAVISALIGFVIHALFPAVDAYILTALPDSTRGSAYAVFSTAWMLSQSGGSSVVGALIEGGYAYGTVFTAGALALVATVAGLAVLERAGRLPA